MQCTDCICKLKCTHALQVLQDISKMWNNNSAPGPFAAFVSRAPIKLTVSKDIQRTILVPEVAELSPQDFAKLYRVNIHPSLVMYGTGELVM